MARTATQTAIEAQHGWPREILGRFLLSLRDRGYLESHRLEANAHRQSTVLTLNLRNGEEWNYEIGDHELVMDGERALTQWLDAIEHDVKRRCRRGVAAPPPEGRGGFLWLDEYAPIDARYREILNAQMEQMRMRVDAQIFSSIVVGTVSDPAAENKAKALFTMVCGAEAYNALNSGNALPITGSKGTKYTLHKRATYCVERVSDKAKLCAVVPGVPLWDHLLGIKLMVEHDEEKFLKTANVSGGEIREWTTTSYSGYQAWSQNRYFDLGRGA